jgi:16S rRNA (uracil1498-N3)-methyltransferase
MALPFFYINTTPAVNTFEVLSEENSKHIVQVLRMQEGKQIKLTDGVGNIYVAEITNAHKKKCAVKILQKEFLPKAINTVCIAVSPVKNNSRLEWFLEKATEMGVAEIVPLICDRTEKQNLKQDRLNGILISAMLQSQQAWLPILAEPKKYATFLQEVKTENKFIAHCEEDKKTSLKDLSNQQTKSTTILIGPEGDFTTAEIELAIKNNFLPVALGSTRLRTETAALVAATLLCVQ